MGGNPCSISLVVGIMTIGAIVAASIGAYLVVSSWFTQDSDVESSNFSLVVGVLILASTAIYVVW